MRNIRSVRVRHLQADGIWPSIGAKAKNVKPALFCAYYSFCRIHQTLRVTPAMEARLMTTFGRWKNCFSPWRVFKLNEYLPRAPFDGIVCMCCASVHTPALADRRDPHKY